ncbi:DUF433 domain-containing protein [Bradyrhizobium sp. CSA207]|uniref:DUF433 domain-containing protein n=1 Tax=Bradyrhizobium sp. CSA207 TaxID=2698826 RepID=UPI0023AF9642|nr:DUF433 domain-containing protein [Bradyrhizobium sp. CSA207]MDE5444401.1 DUF433 domain-containing protein [Bradyrhizobium sp. CSA207]
MRLPDAQVLDGELLLVLHGSPTAMFSATAGIAHSLGCGVHLVTTGMMRRIRNIQRKSGESNIEFLARVAIIDTIAGHTSADTPVVVRRPDVMGGAPVFRGTRVPPGPVFCMLADKSATELVRIDYPSLSQDLVRSALLQACRLLEREAPWADR